MDDNDGDDDENDDGEEENLEDADADYYFAGCDPLQLSSSRCLCSFLQQRGSLLCV